MSIENEVFVEPDRIRIVSRGTFEFEEFKALCVLGFRLAAENGKHKLFYDCRALQGNPTTIERYEMATFVADQYIRRTPTSFLRIALLLDRSVFDPQRFGETVARNRGVPALVTDDESSAQDWLADNHEG